MLYFLKTVFAAVLIVAISELAKRSAILGAILASVPTISVLAILFLYLDTHSLSAVSRLSTGIFWMVLPSLIFFIALPVCLKFKMNFSFSFVFSLGLMIVFYFLMLLALRIFGLRL